MTPPEVPSEPSKLELTVASVTEQMMEMVLFNPRPYLVLRFKEPPEEAPFLTSLPLKLQLPTLSELFDFYKNGKGITLQLEVSEEGRRNGHQHFAVKPLCWLIESISPDPPRHVFRGCLSVQGGPEYKIGFTVLHLMHLGNLPVIDYLTKAASP